MGVSRRDWPRVVRRVRIYLVVLAVVPTCVGVLGVRTGVLHHWPSVIVVNAVALLCPVLAAVGWTVVGRVPARDARLTDAQQVRVRWIVAAWSAVVFGAMAALVAVFDVGPHWFVVLLAAVGAVCVIASLFGPWPRR